ncbi:formate dehydrogenase subunit alpha [Roseobacter denitrificans]|uniref:Formate dehydrogenase, alpha subunit n=1 Tax=Roseobacter denitrificans (strain ATCC 33942 / OCh 114) TaxID=375451 RepID=Q160C3_ROSDO|nr:formate dehydrogenase subunit alpha [Roseobacter denitrificans]ABG33670.1 formate dehydrogenase, alpha subunit [Roseobacter denitrificans OCh 114]AVL52960.1 formate dehydrogenase subunit alpha [Roseobacter denitrificans]SFG02903.1 NAD-dependent formate dehydrogenase catalytic subunit /NAD-dependent formate dehydrogenase iron-sulfur protein [Roseobacter denitrificans OCh 114]
MSESITFTLNGKTVTAAPGETIWEVANGRGLKIPHLCHKPAPGYRPDGNCRACMVEIEGERVLAASCIREPSEGMVVTTDTHRAESARKMVMELLLADQPEREVAHDKSSHLWDMADENGIDVSRFPKLEEGRIPLLDDSHVAMSVNLDACIQCGLCVRACRDVQVNDVIGMAGRGHDAYPTFDFADPMGESTCVACGECVQACPTGALMPSTVVDTDQVGDSADFDSETESVCPFCGVGCKVSLKVKDGKVKYVEGINGPANEGRLCVKGRFGFDYIHHEHRLTKPLIRREDAPPKGLNVDPGNLLTHFREATWEEAMEAAAGGLAKLRQAHGGQSVAGFGSAKCTNEEAYLFQKLIRQGFKHNNVDHCTRLCHASSVAALIENVGSGAVTATFNEIENADVAIVIGANPVENHPVAATYFKQFTKRGGKLIVMDPRGQGLKRFASHMLQFRPGADVSMLNAIMNVIVEENLYDQQYIEAYTENWEAEKEHLKAFTPEAMEPICGIAPEVIRDVARTFAGANAAMIFWGMGVSQHIHGTDNSRCLISLALMTGQVGRPGSGLHPLRGQNNVQGASDAGLIPMFLPDYRSVTDPEVREDIFGVWGRDEDWSDQKGLTVTEIVDQVYAGNIKGMYIQGENPAMSDPDVDHAREAFAKLEHLVVQDIFLTETACFADVILPASALYEKNGTVSNTNRQVQRVRPAVPPPGEAREDWAITVELAQRLGLPWEYTDVSQVFDEMKQVMPSLDNITWERLKTETVTYPSLSETDPGQAVVFGDGFPRPDGRARFTPASVIPPDEAPDTEYPMIMTTGRQLEHWHTGSMTRRASVLDAVEPEANCSLHPKTLRRLGVEPGDMVRLTTRRGSIDIMARSDRAVSEDMVFVPFAYVEAAANVLTNPAIDPYGKIPEFKFAAVRVEAITRVAAE